MTQTGAGCRVAVMQPYLFPYGGYYRLLACADRFLILDCVQFPRRGRVHRCEVPAPGGGLEWLTLPLARQPRDVLIRDLAFAEGAPAEMARRLARHRWIAGAGGPAAAALRATLGIGTGSVVDHLEAQLRLAAGLLGLPAQIMRSSAFGLPSGLAGQERIIALARAAGGTAYVNAPGGRGLYDAARFAEAGLALGFLPPWTGGRGSILPDLLQDGVAALRAQILAQSMPEPV